MKYQNPVNNLIEKRSSWRSYLDKPIEQEKLQKVEKILQTPQKGPFGNKARFKLIDVEKVSPEARRNLGTYGMVRGARYFIAGAINQKPGCYEDYGYLLEQIILFATDLNLGTVWLGGTFRKQAFAKQMNLSDEEILPAITPLGYHPKKRRIIALIIRWFIGANKRKPWSKIFFVNDFDHPLLQEDAGAFRGPLEMVRLAPSSHNGQPWRIVKEKDSTNFHFFVHDKSAKDSSPANFVRIDGGIAMSHFELSLKEKGLKGNWKFLEADPFEHIPSKTHYLASWLGK
ncbi:MAG: nitroreductase [Candidatus Heimdallarchaeota archaeon]|nr:nitroreductase [Candidatus Heimdallarchaeota archaeon]